MKHYKHLTEAERQEIFYIEPEEFNTQSPKEVLSKALGATMYMPATRETIAKEILEQKHISLTSLVIDLEDALEDDLVEVGKENVFKQLAFIEEEISKNPSAREELPLIFIRVRNPQNLQELLVHKEQLTLLTGFILPKFSTANAKEYLRMVVTANNGLKDHSFYAMPVLETKEIIYKEYRVIELSKLKEIIDQYKEIILNVRLGGTDLSGLYSIRRSIDTTVYDIMVVRDCITDILNFFNRGEDEFVVSGVVWEFFLHKNRMLKPTLRETPFINAKGRKNGMMERQHFLDEAVDGLVKEVVLDKSNGIIGKTIIHPSHIRIVNALQVVNEEEYNDALMILGNEGKGVMKSENGNKMNEMKPHLNWARMIIEKSKVYGVLKHGKSYYNLF